MAARRRPGQLRQRLASSHATSELHLGHLIQQHPQSATRGAYRGEGFELRTSAWSVVRAGEGLLITSSARSHGQSTQMDAREAVGQLRAAHAFTRTLSDAAQQHHALAPDAGLVPRFCDHIDPEKNGRHTAP